MIIHHKPVILHCFQFFKSGIMIDDGEKMKEKNLTY
jgi:hypothetical protein